MTIENKYLRVVNASAGSGKTFSLVKTYVQLLLVDEVDKADTKYAEILAMTFTNKAAMEMKTRILKALEELAYPEGSNYIDTIAAETGLKKEVIQVKAKRLLSGILHHYEDFHVLTIDKFNLRLIRSFSRDLDLPPDFEVVLNEQLIIEQVVDGILNRIGSDPVVSQLLLKYASDNLEEEKGWNLRRNLVDFAKILTKEQELPYVNRLMNMQFSEQDYEQHRAEKRKLDASYQERFTKVKSFFQSQNYVVKDFTRGGDIIRYIGDFGHKIKRVGDGFPFTATSLANIEKAADKNGGSFAELHLLVSELKNWYDSKFIEYTILDKYLKNYFNMQLLQFLNEDLIELNRRERLIRISEFNTKISDLLKDDTLYIYEKLGTRFRNFMLDEFQDTSRLQWLNLIPLIRESLGHGNENFIVGDPKQAIYRFKNGVAEQFVELPGIYNPEKDASIAEASLYFQRMGVVESLGDNWRSASDIVAFNNAFFERLKVNLSAYQESFYESVYQNPRSSKRGFIHVESYIKEKEKKGEVILAQMDFIRRSIQDALDGGFSLGDICILGRSNVLCIHIANKLSEDGMAVVSADSLNIDSELTVRFLLSYLKLRLNPVNQNILKQFYYQYCLLFEHDLSFYNSLFDSFTNELGKSYKIANIDLYLSKTGISREVLFESFESLYDLVQKAYLLFGLNELKNPYLHHFADLLHLFESKNGPDLNMFLQDYDSLPKESKSLQVPESDQAIKVMTIHKSKGLEFPVVITINENTKAGVKGEFFIEEEEYLIRTGLKKETPLESILRLYDEETEKNYLDSLNMYYVAYTRPVHRLYISNISDKSSILADFHSIFESYNEAEVDGNKVRLQLGEKLLKQQKSAEQSSYFVPEASNDNLWFPDIALQDSEELYVEDYLSDEQRYGNQFHLLISQVNANEEVEMELQKLILAGLVEKDFEQRLIADTKQLFQTKAYTSLFADAIDILSEQSYLISKNEQIRPDKIICKKDKTVVIDYKTGVPLKKHRKQLEVYRSVLQEMNYPNVEAHLFYTKDFNLVSIE